MTWIRYLAAFIAFFSLYAMPIHAHDEDEQDDSAFDDELNERDWKVLKDYLRMRQEEESSQSPSNLKISGNVRTEFRHMNERQESYRLRGGDATNKWDYQNETLIKKAGNPVSRNDHDIEANIWFDYETDKSWATLHLQYDNSAGVNSNDQDCRNDNRSIYVAGTDADGNPIFTRRANNNIKPGDPTGFYGSGTCDDFCVKAAFFGYNLYTCGDQKLDIEIGRRGNMYRVFDSQVQFLQRFDGILLTYSGTFEGLSDWYWKAGGFLIDEKTNYYGYVTEIGALNIMDLGFDLKYSFIDWTQNGRNRCFQKDPEGMKFMNSQITAYYHIDPYYTWCMPSKLYAAYVMNHDAAPVLFYENQSTTGMGSSQEFIPGPATKGGRYNIAWYVGFEIGKLTGAGDWAFSAQYEYVEAHAVADGDVAGICRGNVLKESITTTYLRGNTNYRGVKFEALYAFTDQITLDTIYEFSNQIDKKIGGSHHYDKFEMEVIYAF